MAEVKVYSLIGNKRNSYDQAQYINGNEFCAAIEAAAASADETVTVSINSGGGAVTDGYAMISAMQKCAKPVKATIDGYAASMGYYICLGASSITASVNSIIMLHSVQGSAAGSPDDLIAEAEVLKKFNATIATLLAARTGLTEAEVTEKYLGKEVWFTAQEALDAKLIDAIEEYNSESVPDVTAGMSYTDQLERFAAMHRAQTEQSLFDRVVAYVKEKLAPVVKTASLNERDENMLCEVLWSVKNATDTAEYCMKECTDPEVAELLSQIVNANAKFVVAITNKVYGEETTDTPQEEMVAKLIGRFTAQKANTDKETALAAAREFVAAELKTKEEALAAGAAQIEALQTEIAELKKEPAVQVGAVKTDKGAVVEPPMLEKQFETSYDREARAKRKQ